jgi:hypothetical protein
LNADNTVKGFFYDSANSKLYVNTTVVAADPNTLHLQACIAFTEPIPGIDVTASGCRIDGVAVWGWAIPQTWGGAVSRANGCGLYSITVDPELAVSTVVSNCDVFYGPWHLIGAANGNGSSCMLLVHGCDLGFMADNTATMAAGQLVVSYTGSGGQEFLIINNTFRAGALPHWSNWVGSGKGWTIHTSGDVGAYYELFIAMDNQFLDGPLACNSDGNIQHYPPVTQLSDVRTFYADNTYVNSNQFPVVYPAQNPGGPCLMGACVINCTYDITFPAGGGACYAWSNNATDYGWLWNNTIEADMTARTGSGVGNNTSVIYTSTYPYLTLIHNAISLLAGDQNMTSFNAQSTANNLDNMRAANNQMLGSKGSGNLYVLLTSDRSGNTIQHHNYYSSSFPATANQYGYGNDANRVVSSSVVTEVVRPTRSSAVWGAGGVDPFGIALEYDQEGKPRREATPSIGPFAEPALGGVVDEIAFGMLD